MSAKRIFLVGDDWSNTGPANATYALRKHLPKNTLYLEHRSKAMRAFELTMKMRKADVAVFSGHSRQNLMGMDMAHRAKIPCIYIMHGCVEHENTINQAVDEGMSRDERAMMERADLILAVSEQFESWLKTNYVEYRDKISHLINGIDWESFGNLASGEKRNENMILSVGGGMPRKRITRICEAIEILKKEGFEDLTLTVVGDEGADTEKINSYPFVNNRGLVDRAEMKRLYHESKLFVQNSIFETFGLAPVEAVLSGADILVSKYCGVLSVLGGMEEKDIIDNPDNPEEIAEKIKQMLKDDNHTRIVVETDKESTSWTKRAEELLAIAQKIKR